MKILGILDFIAGVILVIKSLNFNINESLIALFAFYLLLKGIIFLIGFKDTGSFLDLLCGFFLISTIVISVSPFILIITGLFLIVKGIISLF